MKLYRILAYIIAVEVVVQAAAIAIAVFGLGKWIDDGGVADKHTFEDNNAHFTGAFGFGLHGVNGTLYIPIIAIVFLIVGVVTRKTVDEGLKWAAIVFGLVALQVFLGFMSHAVTWIGPLHGINAFALLGAALAAARRPGTVTQATPAQAEQVAGAN
jgi:heme A synthase